MPFQTMPLTDDPGVVLPSGEQGIATVRNAVPWIVTRQTQVPDAIPAGTTCTVTVGDACFGLAGSGRFLRNDGADKVIVCAAILRAEAIATLLP